MAAAKLGAEFTEPAGRREQPHKGIEPSSSVCVCCSTIRELSIQAHVALFRGFQSYEPPGAPAPIIGLRRNGEGRRRASLFGGLGYCRGVAL